MLLGGLGVMLYQGGLWLRDGHWTYYTVRYAFGELPHSTWGGVMQIIEWFWMQSLAGGLAMGGIAATAAGIFLNILGENA
jgi:hypothetical protein